MTLPKDLTDAAGQTHESGTEGVWGSFLEPHNKRCEAGMHWIDARAESFFALDQIVGLRRLPNGEPTARPTTVLDYDEEWPDDIPWVVRDGKRVCCECVVLLNPEYERILAEVAEEEPEEPPPA